MRGFIFAAKIGKSNVINVRNAEEYGKRAGKISPWLA
jgi:hypothetical protein